jgi:centrosomal protein CEP41
MAKRKGEKHKRIKVSTLARLMTEQSYEESIYNL